MLLVISFDGFRWNYLQETKSIGKETPNFDYLISHGLTAKWVENVFTTQGYTNHFTIVTGMYAESHGLVGNQFYDPQSNTTFSKENMKDHTKGQFFNNGSNPINHLIEPIWITNQRGTQTELRVERHSGVIFWPGSETDFNGMHPHKVLSYNPDMHYVDRINRIISWFTAESDPINLGLLYFEEPDLTGHIVGPDAEEIADQIVQLDKVLGYLQKRLKQAGLWPRINIIITSDHGMAQTSPQNIIELNKYVAPSLYELFGTSPVFQILPKNGKDIIYSQY